MTGKALVETRGLKKYFKTSGGFLHAVDGVDLSIYPGMTLGVVGESGCGKSTLGRTILRLTEATEGELRFAGEDIIRVGSKRMKELRREMQIIFQDPFSSLDPRKTVYDTIAEPLKLALRERPMGKAEIREKVYDLMEMVGLASRYALSYPHEIDGGRRQRIGIARALSVEPKFIVCDEPVSALDVSIQAQILNLLMDLQETRSLTYMFITHDLSVVKHISDEIMIMYMGECVEKAPKEKLFSNPRHPYTGALLSAILRPNIRNRGIIRGVVRGEVSSPIEPKPGCRFAPRCSRATPDCERENIPLFQVEEGHTVRCILEEKQ